MSQNYPMSFPQLATKSLYSSLLSVQPEAGLTLAYRRDPIICHEVCHYPDALLFGGQPHDPHFGLGQRPKSAGNMDPAELQPDNSDVGQKEG
jgi:hypothetical protein